MAMMEAPHPNQRVDLITRYRTNERALTEYLEYIYTAEMNTPKQSQGVKWVDVDFLD